MSCLICERINMIKDGVNPYFVTELDTGYVVMGDHQHFSGYTLFLCKQHVSELHQLPHQYKMKYMEEMMLVAEAVFHVFKPQKLNYELLGNGDSHVHWHLFPRVEGDTPQRGPVWWLPKEEMWNDEKRPNKEVLEKMIEDMRTEIDRLLEHSASIG
ncbi:MAG: histidine triad protein [Herbinix sp.]|nr:histidine triad protein [Herbinix sp.]